MVLIWLLSDSFTCWLLFIVDQIGLSPEEVIGKIMANPDVAMAFQNPRVQAAIMDVSNFFNFYPIHAVHLTKNELVVYGFGCCSVLKIL